jgi:hypothetical protein
LRQIASSELPRILRPSARSIGYLSKQLILACLIASGASQGYCQPDQCKANQANSGDLSLRISLKGGQTVFREGEIIPLIAEYTANTSKKYLLNNRGYDRSGRLSGMEEFCLTPITGVDPLEDYYSNPWGFFGGGLFSEQDPAENPYSVELQINEWLTLPPGHYHLTIVGNRVSMEVKNTKFPTGGEAIPLRSNAVDFEITSADPEWQAAQLSAAGRILDTPALTKAEREHAARVLRFLNSERSTRELARRYWSGSEEFGWEFKLGLYGSPFRSVAIEAMKAALADASHPITREFASTLVELEMLSDPKLRLPIDKTMSPAEATKAREAYDKEFERRVDEDLFSAAATAATKSPEAQAVTASEILQSGSTLTPVARARWRQILIDNWSTLSVERQNELLDYRWESIEGTEWTPVLLGILSGAPNPNHYAGKPSRSVALRRLLETAPETARELILEEIASPKGDIGVGVLGKLPERELPQLEVTLTAGLANGNELDGELIERYAGSSAFSRVRSIYEAHPSDLGCDEQNALLRYFLRVSPDYGLQQVAQSLKERKKTGCFRTRLSAMGEFIRQPKLQDLAIATLDDPAPEVARDAAKALSEFGSPGAEDALWRRLEEFHRRWGGKPDSLLHPKPEMIEYDRDSGLEEALVNGITQGQAWFPTSEQVDQLKALSSPAMQHDLDSIAQTLNDQQCTLLATWLPDGRVNYTVGWYNGLGLERLKEKLKQFPQQIRFTDVSTKPAIGPAIEEFEQIEQIAALHKGGPRK